MRSENKKCTHREFDVRSIESSSLVAAGFGTTQKNFQSELPQAGCRVSSGRSLHHS